MRLELRGIIVGSEYDQDWANDYITKGLIIPESRFRAALAAAPVDQPLDVYINSPGGSVFAAAEMANALKQWRMDHGQPVNVTIGAMAASAASMIAVTVADNIRVHANSKMMFHGAYTFTMGGKEMHQDTAVLLDKINGDVKAALVSRYKLAPETVTEWFAEGREGWLAAGDMVAAGIASDFADGDDGVIEFPKADIADMGKRGLDVAACLKACAPAAETETESTETETEGGGDAGGTNDGGGKSGDSGGDASSGDNDGAAPGNGVDGESPAVDPAADHSGVQPNAADLASAAERESFGAAKYAAGIAAGRIAATEEFHQAVNDLQARLTGLETLTRRLQGERDAARAELSKERENRTKDVAEMTAKLQETEGRLARHLSGSLSFVAGPQTWLAAMEACGGDYATAAKRFPELRRAFNEAKR